ncbi:hypothetical protein ERH_0326 [Erysipelothrix rhusiopathiae str. Fujisawa]|nr:hypothetical protein ERH_0326 [Erysipelothrix rhusiopathiae str. Fujisawa]
MDFSSFSTLRLSQKFHLSISMFSRIFLHIFMLYRIMINLNQFCSCSHFSSPLHSKKYNLYLSS